MHTSQLHRELPAYDQIAAREAIAPLHRGVENIRKLLDSFRVTSPHGHEHTVLVLEAAQMSLRDMQLVFRPDGFDEELVKAAVTELLEGLDFLHSRGEIVHTGILAHAESKSVNLGFH